MIFVSYYSLKNPILFSFLATGYYSQFQKKDSKIEKCLWSISSSLPLVIFSVENFQLWGLPGGIFLVWWWGFGYLIITISLFMLFRKHTYIVISVIFIISFFFFEYAQIQNASKIFFLSNESSKIKFASKNIKTISGKIELINKFDTKNVIKNSTYIIPLFDNPSINENYLKKINTASRFFLFAEHDNLGGFIDSNSSFNNDSYQRKTPWIAYKPIFRTNLKLASNMDPLYCSNIGCTIKLNPKAYPIVWDYKADGTPILLATGQITGDKQIILFGDSDPIVPFLIPYNTEFLRQLFGISDFRIVLEILPVILASLLALYSPKGLTLALSIGFVAITIVAGYLPNSTATVSDINVITDLEIQSPHYDFNYSSLPSRLVKDGYSVSINQKSKSKVKVYIVSGRNNTINKNDQTTLVFLYPESTVVYNGMKIQSGSLPLGNFKDFIEKNSIIVKDARNIFINGMRSQRSIFEQENFVFIASGNPQKNVDLIESIFKRDHKS